MASKRRNPKTRTNRPLVDFGIPDISEFGIDSVDDNDEVNDDDLESELQAILSGKPVAKPGQKPRNNMNPYNIEEMASECMKDISSADEDDLSGDEDLMAELSALTTNSNSAVSPNVADASVAKDSDTSSVSLLKERLSLYNEAESAAVLLGDNTKVRRYKRAIQTLESLLKAAIRGQIIPEEEIPPVVVIPKRAASSLSDNTESTSPNKILKQDTKSKSLRPAPPVPESSKPLIRQETIQPSPVIEESDVQVQLRLRRDEYKVAALKAKKAGDFENVKKYIIIAKKFDAVMEAERNGQPIDLSQMPPPPPSMPEHSGKKADEISEVVPTIVKHPEESDMSSVSQIEAAALAAADEPQDAEMFNAPPPPTTILEALQQRLDKFCATRDAAKLEGKNSKARRLQRIVQQYEGAIKMYKAGKPILFDELPTPPGFGPIPFNIPCTPAIPEPPKPQNVIIEPKKSPALSPPQIENQNLQQGKDPSVSPEVASQGGRHPKIQRANTSSILEKQLNFLLERQKLFRQAALESKKSGDIQQAKEYLRKSKGFDSMIEATKNGLPIDATTIPTPPQLEADFVIVDKSDVVNDTSTENQNNLFNSLEKELQHQIEMCTRNKDHFMCLGDVCSASKFEKLGLESKKDLAFIQHLYRNDESVPIFHYETRLFSLVQCNTDLADNELEVVIERGINLPGKPDELDSFVKIEFPIPNEAPQRAKTHTVRDTNNPIYQGTFKFEINRKSRSNVRQFKRQTLKLDVWSKGGFFKGDTLLGTANVKLVDLETKCTVHNSYDLVEGRRACGGKLEVKVRVRDPLLVKQVEEVREKWLVIGS